MVSRRPRSRRGVVGLVGLAVVLSVASAVVGSVALQLLAPGCVGFDDEGMIRAPASLAGQVVCSADGLGPPRAWLLGLLALVLWLGVEVVWLSARRIVWVVPVAVAVVVSPIVVAALVSALPADCTASQHAAHGSAGCERDLELR